MTSVKHLQQKMACKSQIHLKTLILLDILAFACIVVLRELAVCSWGGWDEQTHYHLFYLLVYVSNFSAAARQLFSANPAEGGSASAEALADRVGGFAVCSRRNPSRQNFFQKFCPSKKVRAKSSIFDS